MTLQIDCPECQQTFEVGEELKGRTVECGSCEKRFKVTDEVIQKDRERVFPDELKKKADLSGFGRAPKSDVSVEFQTADYNGSSKMNLVGPAPLVRTMAAVVGVGILLAILVIFYVGSRSEGGLLTDVDRGQRLLVGGFFGAVGFFLVVWGMVKARVTAILLGILGAGGVLALALLMPLHRSAVDDTSPSRDYISLDEQVRPPTSFVTDEQLSQEEVLKRTRWSKTIQPAIVAGKDGEVMGIWVRGMEEFYRLELQNYLRESLNLPAKPDFRMIRDGGLFLLSGAPLDIDKLQAVVSRFGVVEQSFPEMRLIQMRVSDGVVGQTDAELNAKLNDSSQGAFYSLNYEELTALDPVRVKAAVRRLGNAEPTQLRNDITVRLVALLNDSPDTELTASVAEALSVWSEEGDDADQEMTTIAQQILLAGNPIPDAILLFLAERKTPEAASLLVAHWSRSPSIEEPLIVKYGNQAASLVVPYLKSQEQAVSYSAANLLGQIGNKTQLAEMKKVLEGAVDVEFRDRLTAAIKRIEER